MKGWSVILPKPGEVAARAEAAYYAYLNSLTPERRALEMAKLSAPRDELKSPSEVAAIVEQQNRELGSLVACPENLLRKSRRLENEQFSLQVFLDQQKQRVSHDVEMQGVGLRSELRLLATAETVIQRYVGSKVPATFSWCFMANGHAVILVWYDVRDVEKRFQRSVEAQTLAELAAKIDNTDWDFESSECARLLSCSPRSEGVGVQVNSRTAGSAGHEVPPRIDGASSCDSCPEGARVSEDGRVDVSKLPLQKQSGALGSGSLPDDPVKGSKIISRSINSRSRTGAEGARRGGC